MICNDYLYYYLKNIQGNVYELQSGSAQPHVYSKDIALLKIPVPSLERQNKIIKSLDEHNKTIESMKSSFKLYKQNASEILNSLLSQ